MIEFERLFEATKHLQLICMALRVLWVAKFRRAGWYGKAPPKNVYREAPKAHPAQHFSCCAKPLLSGCDAVYMLLGKAEHTQWFIHPNHLQRSFQVLPGDAIVWLQPARMRPHLIQQCQNLCNCKLATGWTLIFHNFMQKWENLVPDSRQESLEI